MTFFFFEVPIYHFVKAEWWLFLMTLSFFHNHSCHRNISVFRWGRSLASFGVSAVIQCLPGTRRLWILVVEFWDILGPGVYCTLQGSSQVQELVAGRPLDVTAYRWGMSCRGSSAGEPADVLAPRLPPEWLLAIMGTLLWAITRRKKLCGTCGVRAFQNARGLDKHAIVPLW